MNHNCPTSLESIKSIVIYVESVLKLHFQADDCKG